MYSTASVAVMNKMVPPYFLFSIFWKTQQFFMSPFISNFIFFMGMKTVVGTRDRNAAPSVQCGPKMSRPVLGGILSKSFQVISTTILEITSKKRVRDTHNHFKLLGATQNRFVPILRPKRNPFPPISIKKIEVSNTVKSGAYKCVLLLRT